MKFSKAIFLVLFFSGIVCFAQNPSCPGPYIYMDAGNFITVYNPNLPLSATNPSATNIPVLGSGLTLMPNINGGPVSPTFYSIFNNNYWYWNGTAWVDSGHSTGNLSAVNLGGCGTTIYNLVGGTGQVYAYNGTANGTLLTTIPGFNGGGPYDLVTDCNCNFYALNTTTPNQSLSMYSPNGVLQCTYSLTGMPNNMAGGGFAIIGNMIYVRNSSFYVGTISGSVVNFTAVPGFTASAGDFASCPVCYPSADLNGSTISTGSLSCTNTSVNLAVTTTASPVTYFWSGPGIVGNNGTSVITASLAGTYSCVISTSGCPPTQTTLVTSVVNTSAAVLASLTPSGNICVQAGAITALNVAHSASTDIVLWNGPGIFNVTGTDVITVNLPGTYTVSVTNATTGCKATDTMTITQTPTVSAALSSNTVCLNNYNGSPVSITLTPSGAANYTLLTSTNYSTNSPNGPVMACFPSTVLGNFSPLATGTLIGSNGICSNTIITAFTISPNPLLGLSQTSVNICPGNSHTLTAVGANQYTWGGGTGLNTTTGSSVVTTPTASTIYTVMGSSDGCNSPIVTVSVTILPLPNVLIGSASPTICLGSALTLSASGTATSYTWFPATGLMSSPNAAIVNVSPPSSQIYMVVGSLNTCTSFATTTVTIVQPPVLSLSLNNFTVCAQNFNGSPNSIQFTPGGALNYTLQAGANVSVFSPNGPVMQAVPILPLINPSVETLTLTGRSGVCTVSMTQTISVIPNPTITVSPSTASVCPKQSQGFSVSGATTYTWLPMANYTVTGNNSIVANPSITSFYSAIGSSLGCNSGTRNGVLIILPIPTVTVSPRSTTVCAGNSVPLQASGNATGFQWFPATGLSSTVGTQVTATPPNTRDYTVLASYNTCTNSAVITISVITIPVITVTASQPTICSGMTTNLKGEGADSFYWFPNTNLSSPAGSGVIARLDKSTTFTAHGYNGICTGSTTLFVETVKRPDMYLTASANQVCHGGKIPISVTGAQNYNWAPADAFISTGTNTEIIASPVVSTNYTVFGSNSLGNVSCYQQLSYSVIVVSEIQAAVSENKSICAGEKVTLYASGGNSFKWIPSSGLNITNGPGVVAKPLSTTIYTVEVSHDTYCGKTTTVMVSVNPKPSVFAGRDTVYNLNEAIFLNATGSGTLNWTFGENIACKSCTTTQVYPTRNGCYVVETVNEFGCTAIDDVCLELTEEFSIYIPNSFTPNNDGKNDVFLIYGENLLELSLEIYDRWGIRVFQSEDPAKGWDGKYKDVLCSPGIYTYIVNYTGLNRKKYMRHGHISILK